jgi:hypothetical protein
MDQTPEILALETARRGIFPDATGLFSVKGCENSVYTISRSGAVASPVPFPIAVPYKP